MNIVQPLGSFADADGIVSPHRNLRCFAAWRSIGSNVFFEFGTPVAKLITPKTGPAFTVFRGQASVGIHGDNWRLLLKGDEILDSDDVDDLNVDKVAQACLIGSAMPTLALNGDGWLELRFEREITMVVERNDQPHQAGNADDLVAIELPGAWLCFNYDKGFYSPPPDA